MHDDDNDDNHDIDYHDIDCRDIDYHDIDYHNHLDHPDDMKVTIVCEERRRYAR